MILKPYFCRGHRLNGFDIEPDTNIGIYFLTAKYFNFIFKYLCTFFDYIVTSWKLGAIPGTEDKQKNNYICAK